jgi:hypothetical protein
MHSDSTLSCFDNVTQVLGSTVRRFLRTTCEAYTTYELPQEETRRQKRQAAKNAKGKSNAKTGKKRKTWNIYTYKYHSFGDYGDAIKTYGTTDSYSTQIVGSNLLSHTIY